MVIRYAILMALAAALVWALFDVGATRAPIFLVDAGYTAAAPAGAPSNVAFWLFASIAMLITFSLCRFVFFGLPSMVDGWYQDRKYWIYTILGGGPLYAVFHLMKRPDPSFWGSLAGTLPPRPRRTRRRFGRPGQSGAVAKRGRPIFFHRQSSDAVIHVELDRVRHHLEALHLFHLQLEVGVDHVVGEHAALLQEVAVLVELLEASRSEPHTVGIFDSSSGGRSYRFLSIGSPGWILFSMPSRPAISMAAKAR